MGQSIKCLFLKSYESAQAVLIRHKLMVALDRSYNVGKDSKRIKKKRDSDFTQAQKPHLGSKVPVYALIWAKDSCTALE